MNKRLFTNEQAKAMRDKHHKEGLSIVELCEHFCPDRNTREVHATIRQILLGITYKNAGGKLGIVATHNDRMKITPNEREKIREYFADGTGQLSQTEMAEAYGVSKAYISRIVSGER